MQTRITFVVEEVKGVPLEQLTAELSAMVTRLGISTNGMTCMYYRGEQVQRLKAQCVLVAEEPSEPTPVPMDGEVEASENGDITWN